MFPWYEYGASFPALLWSSKDFLKGKGRVAATGQGRGRGRILLPGKDARERQDGTGGRAARGAEQGMANELVELGDDRDLYVDGLNRLTVSRRNVSGQVWRTLIFIVDLDRFHR